MPDLDALLFDVFGTLVDWRTSLLSEATGLQPAPSGDVDWPVVVDDWRRAYQPALDRVREERRWRDLDEVQRQTLVEVVDRHGVQLTVDQRESLVQAWRRLRPWPDTPTALRRLRLRVRTATLSNGHLPLLVELARFSDLRVDALLSAQLADSYKPDPRTYLRAAELLGSAPARTGMVAAHADDLVAAARVGLRPIFVRRPDEWGPGIGSEPPPDLADLVVVDDLEQLADLLGC